MLWRVANKAFTYAIVAYALGVEAVDRARRKDTEESEDDEVSSP